MICKNCGHDTTYVICEHCGMNVVWYNRYGCQHDLPVDDLSDIKDFLTSIFDNTVEELLDNMFIPD